MARYRRQSSTTCPSDPSRPRVRSLDVQRVEQLIEYERNDAERVQVLNLLQRRRDQLHDGHEPTGGTPNWLKTGDRRLSGQAGQAEYGERHREAVVFDAARDRPASTPVGRSTFCACVMNI